MMAPYVNKVSLTTSEWNDDSRSHVLPPHGLNPWEDAALPPHELNRWEDSQHKHLSYHHMHSNMGRTLNLPPHELNHREVHLSRMRVGTLPNHSSATTQVECLWLRSGFEPIECYQTYPIRILIRDCPFIIKNREKYIYKSKPDQKHKLYTTLLYSSCTHSSSPPKVDCKSLLILFEGGDSTCSFI